MRFATFYCDFQPRWKKQESAAMAVDVIYVGSDPGACDSLLDAFDTCGRTVFWIERPRHVMSVSYNQTTILLARDVPEHEILRLVAWRRIAKASAPIIALVDSENDARARRLAVLGIENQVLEKQLAQTLARPQVRAA